MRRKSLFALAILLGALILHARLVGYNPWTVDNLRAELLWRFRRADLLWHFQADDRGFGSSPTVVEGVLYGSISDHVKALDAATGELIWRYETDDYWGTDLTVADGTVYVADEDVVDTLDAASGALLRRYEMGDSRWTSAPAVDEEVMYLYTNGLNLIALDLASGEILWRYHTELFFDAPVVAEGVIYVGTVGPDVYASDAVSGELLWRFPPREDSSSSLLLAEGPLPAGGHSLSMAIPLAHIAVAAGVVYAGSFNGRLYALDAVSGKPLWSVQVGVMRSAPTVAERVLYVGSSNQQYGYVRAFDAATGERLWRYWVVAGFDRMVGGFVDTPTVADGVVYVSSGEGHVYALDAAGGELLWYFRTGEGWTDAPMVADGVVYIASSNGIVYALRPAAVE